MGLITRGPEEERAGGAQTRDSIRSNPYLWGPFGHAKVPLLPLLVSEGGSPSGGCSIG